MANGVGAGGCCEEGVALACGVVTRTAARVVPSPERGNREDAFVSPQSEKDGPADAAAEAFYNSCARPICTAEDQQQITDKKASSIRALNFQVAAATAIAHVGLSDYAL